MTMDIREKIIEVIKTLNVNDIYTDVVICKAIYNNVWFTEKNIAEAISEVKILTNVERLSEIYGMFPKKVTEPKKVAVVMSGTTPLANFKDMLYVLLSGNVFMGKMSNDDPYLLKAYTDAMIQANPDIATYIRFMDGPMSGFDAIIVDNNGRNDALADYFSNIPHLFRTAGDGACIIKGDESQTELEKIAHYCFINFGRGTSSVRNLYVPKNYDFKNLLKAFEEWNDVKDNPKYFNNYEYRKSACIIGGLKHTDNGFVILRQGNDMNPNVSEIFYHEYESLPDVIENFQNNASRDELFELLIRL